ncbi:formate dehydrogenase family accessory protein FdhD [Paenibacillus algicola]|uniref:Probable molybdenum cofactor guanylyltransferase n=1 Tax=Paenibacillus algicola TaxID=2565926 RepID=A0A4P8XPQ1_9BACL|nr:molybdenum cofactor guanylyltransferase [Paenibacillus algicola]QCT04638.1 formate dehydrogenase family accessory protein FdhD [Paenibacillus algicola]
MAESITGILLAGGRSRRMGQDKALLRFGRLSCIEQVQSALSVVCSDLLISANASRSYDFLGLPRVEDQYPGQGPLAGLHAGLKAARTSWSLVSACDMPLVTEGMASDLARMVRSLTPMGKVQAVVPVAEGRPQPLFAAYHDSAATVLEQRLQRGELRMMDALGELTVKWVPLEELAVCESLHRWREGLFNMNEPKDYERLKGLHRL